MDSKAIIAGQGGRMLTTCMGKHLSRMGAVRHWIMLFFILCALLACSGKNKDAGVGEKETKKTKKSKVSPIRESLLPVSKDFVKLIEQFDTAGFAVDAGNGALPELVVGDYILQQVPLDDNVIRQTYNQIQEAPEWWESELGVTIFDIRPFEKVSHITRFQYKQRVPRVDERGQQWYADGWVEEWTFASSRQAKWAFKETEKGSHGIFFKTGGSACYKKNRMYLFSSRATEFVYEQQPFFKSFVKEIKADGSFSTIP